MDGTERRHRVDTHPRSATGREWELFVRESVDDALQHVGSVTAPDAEVAYEQATMLFGEDAADVWVCPATEVTRFVSDGVESANASDGAESEVTVDG